MSKELTPNYFKFQIVFLTNEKPQKVFPLEKVRTTIGSSDVCDIQIKLPDISAIHAVVESRNDQVLIYDMSSTNGTFVNGERIVCHHLKLGDKFNLSHHSFLFRPYCDEDILPPPLENLPRFKSKMVLPSPPSSLAQKNTKNKDKIPKVIFPLSSDPSADKIEYIFEDSDLILPIFKYNISSTSIEVIIIFKELVYSVDFLPAEKGFYHIEGLQKTLKNIEFPFFGKTEKIPFVEVKNDIFIFPLPGLEMQIICDSKESKNSSSAPIILGKHDIVRYFKKDLQIFVRNTDSPPVVNHAPLFNKDHDFNKYLILMMLFAFFVTVTFNLVKIEKPIEKENAPERIASIIYKKTERIKQGPVIEVKKTQDVSPVDKIEEKIPEKVTGSPTVEKAKIIKKATPPKSSVDNLTTDVVRPKPSPQIAKKGSSSAIKSSPKVATTSSNSQGNVEMFNAAGLQGGLSSLLSKGGETKSKSASFQANKNGRGEMDGVANSLYDSGGPSASLQRSKVSGQVGSLTGSAQGKMDISKGAEGISDKKSIYTAGLPYKTIILGGLDPEIIRRILIENLEQFRFCYQKMLDSENKSFSGVVKMNFIIGATGNVTRAAVETSDPNLHSNIKLCVSNVLKGIQFPAPRGGGVVEVDQPFNFYPKSF